jgi:hypothetical protein
MQQYAPSKPHDRTRECRTCAHFKGERTGTVRGFEDQPGVHIVCERDAPHLMVRGEHASCCCWMREPGADDE